jgi:lysyl-tRNA synthetase class II
VEEEAVGEDYSKDKYGHGKLIQSAEKHSERNFVPVDQLSKATSLKTVWVRGRVHTSRCKGKQCFIVLRQQSSTVQVLICVNDVISKQMVKFSGS